jgi:hypothetical protein
MTVRLNGEQVRLEGECRVEEAETLVTLLQAAPDRIVDVSAAGHLHAAVFQVLLAMRPRMEGAPADAFVKQWLLTGRDDNLPEAR